MSSQTSLSSSLSSLIDREITHEMESSYINYAMSVIITRALPDVRDGLKPVHRRILYSMQRNGLHSKAKLRKSATVVGDVIGKYHPHGDSSVYEAMVRLAQDFSLRYPLIRGQGNFGSIDGDSAAAMRYTEAKMMPIAEELLADLDKETVNFQDNYDGSHKEPKVLPSKIPNLLLNGTMGIAVGMATNIPPHNLTELINGMVHLIENPEATLDELMEYIKGPDFPTGGMIYDVNAIKKAYATGRGSIVMRGKAEIIENGNRTQIIITEIPYQVNKAALVERIAELVREKIIVGVTGLRDESSREGIRIVLDLKKDAFPKKILNILYKNTALQSSFGCNFVALVEDGKQPQLLDLKTILEEFIKHRKSVVRRRTEYELKIAKARAHILEGLSKALDHIDQVIATIRSSETKDLAKQNLMTQFHFSELQTDAILAMRLQTLAGLERKKIEDELKEKKLFIADCEDILANPERITAIVKEEFLEIKAKYQDERKTIIIPHSVGEITTTDIIPNEAMIVTLSQFGYIKRMSPSSYRTQGRGGKGLLGAAAKTEDAILLSLSTYNHNTLLFFTSFGRVFRLPVYEIPEVSRTAKGQALVNFLQLSENETVTSVLDSGVNAGKYLFFCTEQGIVKKVETEQFKNIRTNGLIALGLKDNDVLKWVKFTSGEDEVMIITKEGKGIRFSEEEVRAMGRQAAGVRGIRLAPNDSVVGMDIVNAKDDKTSQILVIMENGLGKSTPVSEYRAQGRGGGGVKTANVTNKTGKVVFAGVIASDFSGDLLLSAKSGQAIRMAYSQIPSQGRATQGVILMRLPADDIVSTVSIIERDLDSDTVEITEETATLL